MAQADDETKEPTTANGLPIEGMSGLFPQGEEEEQQQQPEPTPEGASEQVPNEEVLNLDEFTSRFGTTKVKVQIAGEEHLLSPADAIRYQQRYSGLEKNTERKTQEASRILDEIREQSRNIQAQISGAQAQPNAEPIVDEDTPEGFVRKGVQDFVTTNINPKLERLEAVVNGLATALEPTLAEGNKKSAVAILGKNGIEIDVPTFETYHDKMVQHIENHAGRTLTDTEVKRIKPSVWAQTYLVVSHGAPVPKAEPVDDQAKTQAKRRIAVPAGGGGLPPGGANAGPSLDQLTQTAKETGDWTPVLRARGVKPLNSGG